MKPSALLAVLACWSAMVAQTRGEIILSETFTGAELYSDSRVSFPSRTPLLQGTSLYYDTGTVDFEKLLVLNLLPQGALDISVPVIVHILGNFTVQNSPSLSYPTDHDPGIGIGNGALFGGLVAADNTDGDWATVLYPDSGAFGASAPLTTIFTGVGYPSTGQELTFDTTITLTTAATQIQGAFGGKSGSHTYPAIDLNAPLSVVVFAHDSDERYKLNSLQVDVQGTRAVPEPSIFISLTGLFAIGLVTRLRRKWAQR